VAQRLWRRYEIERPTVQLAASALPSNNSGQVVHTYVPRVFNGPEFSGRHDFQAKKNWTSVYKIWKSCSRPTRKLKQKFNAKQYLGPTTYVSLMHQHRS